MLLLGLAKSFYAAIAFIGKYPNAATLKSTEKDLGAQTSATQLPRAQTNNIFDAVASEKQGNGRERSNLLAIRRTKSRAFHMQMTKAWREGRLARGHLCRKETVLVERKERMIKVRERFRGRQTEREKGGRRSSPRPCLC
jgi:hypothetical protein